MKFCLLAPLLLLSFFTEGQPCELLTKTFAMADTIKTNPDELYRFRFSGAQLDALLQFPGLEKPVVALKKLQKTLDEDNASLQKGTLWQLDEKLAENQLTALRKECPETGFKVFDAEIAYYKSKYQKAIDAKEAGN